MDETIEQLLQLQEIDTMLAELERKRALVPKRLAEEQATVEAAKLQVTQCKERIREKEKERRALEKDIKELDDSILKYQTQLNTAKTNEEYRALLSQIERAKAKQSETEDRVLVLMEELERAEQALRQAEEHLKSVEEVFRGREHDLNQLAASLDEGIRVKRAQRHTVASALDPATLKRYERILRGNNGLAVAVVENYVCGGCHGVLPPQTVNEIRKRDRLYTCQFCGRIVVTRS